MGEKADREYGRLKLVRRELDADAGGVLALQKEFEQLPAVSNVITLASLTPGDQGPELEMLRQHSATARQIAQTRRSDRPCPAKSGRCQANL